MSGCVLNPFSMHFADLGVHWELDNRVCLEAKA
jgi:hypothetical protein